jgi:3',5'-cyclic AMP phosphodiesterase CpdA
MNRRSFVANSLSTAAIGSSALPASAQTLEAAPGRPALRCSSNGTFRILAISDLHYRPEVDHHGIALTETLIDTEKPSLVVVNGDCLSGNDCKSAAKVRKAISNVAAAMESRRVPWVITFGNHDQEHEAATRIDKHAVMEMYAAYPHNLNAGYAKGLYGVGEKYILIWNAEGTQPVYCVWLIDSNAYFVDGKNTPYDWIHSDQIQWYTQSSLALEKQYGRKIPGLMFFHIPLPEFREMVNTVKIIGVRQEKESHSPVNGGMFAALLERGDVRGVYCGHDHVNNYMGRWRGIELGFDGCIGHHTYPRLEPDDPGNLHVRGGRVFEITASAPARHRTWMRFKSGAMNWESASEALTKDHVK